MKIFRIKWPTSPIPIPSGNRKRVKTSCEVRRPQVLPPDDRSSGCCFSKFENTISGSLAPVCPKAWQVWQAGSYHPWSSQLASASTERFKQRWNMFFTDLHYLDTIQLAIWHHQGWSSLRCMADGNAIYAAYGHGWLESGFDEVIIDILKVPFSLQL